MTDEEYHEKMFRTNHSNTCSWGWDQYWWECDCGAIPVDELHVERHRRLTSPAHTPQETEQ